MRAASRMHVALHHPGIVPPPQYGGTERVVDALARALLEMGHRVTLMAFEGSRVEGAEHIVVRRGDSLRDLVPADVDVVHTRDRVGDTGRPTVYSVDGNGAVGETFHANSLFVSRRHAANHMTTQFVHNGIDPAGYACEDEREDYAVFLAMASWPVKNVRGAIQVARAAKMPLHVIGGMSRRQRVERWLPHLRHVTWHGSIDEDAKRAILSRARSLIFPVRWEEPFGLAVTEALASGCSVLGTPYGALPEIVTPEVGALSAHGTDLARALRQARDKFDPRRCRARVVEGGFTHHDMARAALRHYESVIQTGRVADAAPNPPRTRPGFDCWEPLAWFPPR